MKTENFLPFKRLPRIEQILIVLVLIFSWAGVAIAFCLIILGYLENPGDLIWSLIFASLALAALALLRPKKDIVSILTPIYAILIFFSLEIPRNMILMFLYACTLTAILWRLEKKYGNPGSIQ
jgi:hypothetical protein